MMKKIALAATMAALFVSSAFAAASHEVVYSYVYPEQEPDSIWTEWEDFTTCDVEWGEFDGGYFNYDMPVLKRVSKDPQNSKYQFAFIKWFPLGPTMVVEYDPATKHFRVPVQWRGANNAWDGEPHLTCGWREYFGTDDPYSTWDDVNGVMHLYTMSYYPNQDLGDGKYGNKPTTPVVDIIRMKGFTKYDVDIDIPECINQFTAKTGLNITPHPKNVSWELVNDLVLKTDTAIIDRIAADKKNLLPETAEIEMTFKEGVNTIVCISYDDKDQRVVSLREVYCMPGDEGNWKSIGNGYFVEDAIVELGSDFSSTRLKVEIQESGKKPGMYRLVNPYKGLPDVWDNFTYNHADHNHYLYIDASRANAVMLGAQPTGITDPRIGNAYLTSKAYEEKRIGKLQPDWIAYCGQLKDNKITFPKESVGIRVPSYTAPLGKDYIYWVNYNEDFAIELPSSGVDSIDVSEDVVPEYYNLQGLRINAPEDGEIVIVKRGGKTMKEVFRSK